MRANHSRTPGNSSMLRPHCTRKSRLSTLPWARHSAIMVYIYASRPSMRFSRPKVLALLQNWAGV